MNCINLVNCNNLANCFNLTNCVNLVNCINLVNCVIYTNYILWDFVLYGRPDMQAILYASHVITWSMLYKNKGAKWYEKYVLQTMIYASYDMNDMRTVNICASYVACKLYYMRTMLYCKLYEMWVMCIASYILSIVLLCKLC